MQTAGTLSYNPRFDGLRCVAVAGVLLFHLARSAGGAVSSGFYGVNLFFVLSGFLITSILLQPSDNSTTKQYFVFLGRRVLRIFPIYYLALAVVYFANTPNIHERLPYLLTYTYNIIQPGVNWHKDYTAHFWSLCVEEQFYVFFPLVVLALKNRWKSLIGFCAACVLLAWAQPLFNIYGVSGNHYRLQGFNYTSLTTNIAPLCLGALLAIAKRQQTVPSFLRSGFAEGVSLFVIAFTLIYLPLKYQLIFCSLANVILLAKADAGGFSTRTLDRVVTHRYACYIGRISYGIYVYHLIIRNFMDDYVINPLWSKIDFSTWGVLAWLQHHSGPVRLASCLVLTILAAHLSYSFIETPILKLREKMFPGQRAGKMQTYLQLSGVPEPMALRGLKNEVDNI